jgi:hypothetical protein
MNLFPRIVLLLMFGLLVDLRVHAASSKSAGLTPIRNTVTRGPYTIDTVGDTLHQARPENTRLIIRIADANKKMVKPATIALVDKNGAVIKPIHREDRKVGHEENTGLPLSLSPQANSSGYNSMGVGVNLNKILGSHGDYAYTKVDWPKELFTADKQLQIVLPGGQSYLLPLTSLAR